MDTPPKLDSYKDIDIHVTVPEVKKVNDERINQVLDIIGVKEEDFKTLTEYEAYINRIKENIAKYEKGPNANLDLLERKVEIETALKQEKENQKRELTADEKLNTFSKWFDSSVQQSNTSFAEKKAEIKEGIKKKTAEAVEKKLGMLSGLGIGTWAADKVSDILSKPKTEDKGFFGIFSGLGDKVLLGFLGYFLPEGFLDGIKGELDGAEEKAKSLVSPVNTGITEATPEEKTAEVADGEGDKKGDEGSGDGEKDEKKIEVTTESKKTAYYKAGELIVKELGNPNEPFGTQDNSTNTFEKIKDSGLNYGEVLKLAKNEQNIESNDKIKSINMEGVTNDNLKKAIKAIGSENMNIVFTELINKDKFDSLLKTHPKLKSHLENLNLGIDFSSFDWNIEKLPIETLLILLSFSLSASFAMGFSIVSGELGKVSKEVFNKLMLVDDETFKELKNDFKEISDEIMDDETFNILSTGSNGALTDNLSAYYTIDKFGKNLSQNVSQKLTSFLEFRDLIIGKSSSEMEGICMKNKYMINSDYSIKNRVTLAEVFGLYTLLGGERFNENSNFHKAMLYTWIYKVLDKGENSLSIAYLGSLIINSNTNSDLDTEIKNNKLLSVFVSKLKGETGNWFNKNWTELSTFVKTQYKEHPVETVGVGSLALILFMLLFNPVRKVVFGFHLLIAIFGIGFIISMYASAPDSWKPDIKKLFPSFGDKLDLAAKDPNYNLLAEINNDYMTTNLSSIKTSNGLEVTIEGNQCFLNIENKKFKLTSENALSVAKDSFPGVEEIAKLTNFDIKTISIREKGGKYFIAINDSVFLDTSTLSQNGDEYIIGIEQNTSDYSEPLSLAESFSFTPTT